MVLVNKTTVRVRLNETDALGIVWHGHYLSYFEDGREAFGMQYGIGNHDIFSQNLMAPMVKCTCDFKASLTYGDQVIIETRFINTPAAKIIFRYSLYRTDGKIAATGETVQVFTDPQGELVLYPPPFFENWKQKFGLA